MAVCKIERSCLSIDDHHRPSATCMNASVGIASYQGVSVRSGDDPEDRTILDIHPPTVTAHHRTSHAAPSSGLSALRTSTASQFLRNIGMFTAPNPSCPDPDHLTAN